MKILIVEDSKLLTMIYKEQFSQLGTIVIVDCFVDAIESVKNALLDDDMYDLILLDVVLPDISGLLGIKIIRAMEEVSKSEKSKIFMTTGQSDKQTIVTALRNGANDYLIKPFNKESLAQKIRSLGQE